MAKVHVEIEVEKNTIITDDTISQLQNDLLNLIPSEEDLQLDFPIKSEEFKDGIKTATICNYKTWPPNPSDFVFHFYTLNTLGQESLNISEGDNDSETITTSNHWMLPNRDFNGLWESLIFEEGIKENILKYVESIVQFSKKQVNENIISCNRLILLHGPPGTGKTSLCQALAQKLSIRFNKEYKYMHLIEINSHSLFSKWFSESGKLVMKMFAQIREIVEHKQSMVIILIDEIESIVSERSSISSNEPTDSLRVVNAVLTQLDQIRKFSNVLILTTSNLTASIDLAFISRADLLQFIGPPSAKAIFHIYKTIVDELVKCGIVAESGDKNSVEGKLKEMAAISEGISGRTLRKLPIIAHAFYAEQFDHSLTTPIPMIDFLSSMRNAIEKHKLDCHQVGRRAATNNTII